MTDNEQVITRFYTAFANKDYAAMQQCYADDVVFSDNAFPGLNAKQAKAMWHMLVNAGKDMQVTFTNVTANKTTGSADWEATYSFSLTGRKVINRIHAEFEFKNGLIIKHTDTFDFWKWASQAFGLTGQLLGWTSFFKKKIQAVTRERLQAFIGKNPVYQ
jgi:ketosteroid isomerase-like protein